MNAPVAFYAHHQGRGHLHRVLGIASELQRPALVLTSCEVGDVHVPSHVEVVELPDDVPDGPAVDPAPGARLHWAPIDPCTTARAAAITEVLAIRRPSRVVVDVSVEVAVLARLCGVPVTVVRLHGDRTDSPHQLASDLADSFLAPWTRALEDPSTPDDVAARTSYVGGIIRRTSRRDRAHARVRLGLDPTARVVTVVRGSGGAPLDAGVLDAVGGRGGWVWNVIGPVVGTPTNAAVHGHGWVCDPQLHLDAADVVVTGAGDGTLAEVAAADRSVVVIPEPRPHREQQRKAVLLASRGVVVRPSWPDPGEWAEVLDQAAATGPVLAECIGTGGASRAAALLD